MLIGYDDLRKIFYSLYINFTKGLYSISQYLEIWGFQQNFHYIYYVSPGIFIIKHELI